MIDVGGDNHAAGGNFVAHNVRRELLFFRNVRHLLGDYAKTGVVHLREVLIVAFGGLFTSADDPFSPRLRHCDSIAAMRSISTSAVVSAHLFAPFASNKNYTHLRRRKRNGAQTTCGFRTFDCERQRTALLRCLSCYV